MAAPINVPIVVTGLNNLQVAQRLIANIQAQIRGTGANVAIAQRNARAVRDETKAYIALRHAISQTTAVPRTGASNLQSVIRQRRELNNLFTDYRRQVNRTGQAMMQTGIFGGQSRMQMPIGMIDQRSMLQYAQGVEQTFSRTVSNADLTRVKIGLLKPALSNFATHITTIGKNAQWTGRQLMMGLTVPVIMAIRKTTSLFLAVSKEMTRMRKVSGIQSDDKWAQISPNIEKNITGVVKKFGIAQKEVAKLTADVVAMGYSVQGTTSEASRMTEEISYTSTLGDIGLSTARDFYRTMMKVFGQSAEGVRNFNDQILATNFIIDQLNQIENKTVINLNQLADAMPKAAGAAKLFGLNGAELGSVLTGIYDKGIALDTAATGLNFILTRILNPTKQAQEYFDGAFGKGALSSIQQLGSGMGKLIKLSQMYGDLASKGGPEKANKAEAGRIFSELVQRRQIKTFVPLAESLNIGMKQIREGIQRNAIVNQAALDRGIDPLKASYEELTPIMRDYRKELLASQYVTEGWARATIASAAYANTATDDIKGLAAEFARMSEREVKIKLEAPETQMAILKESFKMLGAELGKVLLPSLLKIMGALESFFQKLSDMPKPVKLLIANIALLTAAIGPVVYIAGTFATAFGLVFKSLIGILPGIQAVTAEWALMQVQMGSAAVQNIVQVGDEFYLLNRRSATLTSAIMRLVGARQLDAEAATAQAAANNRLGFAQASSIRNLVTQSTLMQNFRGRIAGFRSRLAGVPRSIMEREVMSGFSRAGTGAQDMSGVQLYGQTRRFYGSPIMRRLGFARTMGALENGPGPGEYIRTSADSSRIMRAGILRNIFGRARNAEESAVASPTVARMFSRRFRVGQFVAGTGANVTQGLTAPMSGAFRGWALAFSPFRRALTATGNGVMRFGSGLGRIASGPFRTIMAGARGGMARAAVTGGSRMLGAIGGGLGGLVTGAAGGVSSLAAIASVIGGLIGPLLVIVPLIVGAVVFIKKLVENWDTVVKAMRPGIEAIKKAWNGLLTVFKDIGKIFTDAMGTIETTTTNSGGRVVSFWEQFGTFIGKMLNGVSMIIKGVGLAIKALSPVFKWLADQSAAMFNVIINIVKAVMAIFKGDWGDAWNYFYRAVLYAIKYVLLLAKPFTGFINLLVKTTLKAVSMILGVFAKIPGVGKMFSGLAKSVGKLSKTFNITSVIDKWLDKSLKRDVKVGINYQVSSKSRQSMVGAEPDKENLPTGGAGKDAGKNTWEDFLNSLKEKLDNFISKLKDMIGKAFDEVWAARLKVYDDQIKAIDDLQKKEDELLATQEYNQQRRDLLNKRSLDQQNYVRNRALAIYEGRIDDARMMDLEFSQTNQSNNKAIADLDTQRARDLLRAQREIEKERISVAKTAAEERKRIEEEALKAQLDLITQYTPRTGVEWENMMNQINDMLTNYGIPKMVGAWNDGLAMFTLAVGQVNADIPQMGFWKGEWIDDAISDWYSKILGWDIKGLMKQKTQEAQSGVSEGAGGAGGVEDTGMGEGGGTDTKTPKRPFTDEEKSALRTKLTALQKARGDERKKIFESLTPPEVEFLKGERTYAKYRDMAITGLNTLSGRQAAQDTGLQNYIKDRQIKYEQGVKNRNNLASILATPVTKDEKRWAANYKTYLAQNKGSDIYDFMNYVLTDKSLKDQNDSLYKFLATPESKYTLPKLSQLDKSPLLAPQKAALAFFKGSLKNAGVKRKDIKKVMNQLEREIRTFGRVLTEEERAAAKMPALSGNAKVWSALPQGSLEAATKGQFDSPKSYRSALAAENRERARRRTNRRNQRTMGTTNQRRIRQMRKFGLTGKDVNAGISGADQEADFMDRSGSWTPWRKPQKYYLNPDGTITKNPPKIVAERRWNRQLKRNALAATNPMMQKLATEDPSKIRLGDKKADAKWALTDKNYGRPMYLDANGKWTFKKPGSGKPRRRDIGDDNLRSDTKKLGPLVKKDSEFLADMKAQGIKTGLIKNRSMLHAAEINYQRGGLQAVKDYLGIQSPSQLYADKVGKPIAAGIARGVEAPSSKMKLGLALNNLINPFLNQVYQGNLKINFNVTTGGIESGLKKRLDEILGGDFVFNKGGFKDLEDFIKRIARYVRGILNGMDMQAGYKSKEGPLYKAFEAAIPALATGGIVKRRSGGILAQIGEGRYDEAVIPLPNGLKNFSNSFQPASVSMSTFEGSIQSAMVQALKECAPYMGGDGSGGVTIYVDNFIGQPQWFESMMSEYGVKVAPNKQRAYGTMNRKITSYQDNSYRTGKI